VVIAALLLSLQAAAAAPPPEERFYRLETLALPEGLALEVGGLIVLRDGRPMACTRRGEVWIVENAYGAGEPRFERFAQGLHEPLGLLERDDGIYVVQRGELSRMRDLDGDGRMDALDTVCDAWPISGNYHEYAFGPALDGEGNYWVTTNKPFGDEPFGRAKWRGFALKITPAGVMTPECCGLRSPCGVEASPWGEVFYTDNQGEWCGAGKLAQLRPGGFHGHPWGTFACEDPLWRHSQPGDPPNGETMPEVARRMPTFELPAVWFPYDEMGRSPAGFAWDPSGGAFGPFEGQVFVADQYQSSVLRVFLERVGGRWQGACFPFRKGFQSGVVRLAFAPDGSLFCGETDRGWGSLGGKTMGLERLVWTGVTPFEVRRMRATPEGFELEFTAPVERVRAGATSSYSIESYTYLLHETYGSDEVDRAQCPVRAARVSADGTTVALTVEGLREGYVHELRSTVESAAGEPLLHAAAYYTLIERPLAAPAVPR
jgi:glucose/arabinose dehydrogenase